MRCKRKNDIILTGSEVVHCKDSETGEKSMAGKYALYQQLADSLRDKIYEREYAFGDKMPPERTLAEKFGISHLTVRKALAILEEEGLILRIQGKGTFVRAPKVSIDMRRLEGFSTLFRQQGITIVNRVLYSGLRPAKFKYSHIFGISPEEEVFECIRLRQSEELPLAIEYNVVPQKYVPDIANYDYSVYSLHDIYEKNEIQIVEEQQKLELVKIYNPQADLLNLEEGADVFKISALSFDEQNRAIEWTKIYDNTKRIVFYASTI